MERQDERQSVGCTHGTSGFGGWRSETIAHRGIRGYSSHSQNAGDPKDSEDRDNVKEPSGDDGQIQHEVVES